MTIRSKALIGLILLTATFLQAQSVQISFKVPVSNSEGDDILFKDMPLQQSTYEQGVFPIHLIQLDSHWAHVFQLKIQLPAGVDSVYVALLRNDSIGGVTVQLEACLHPNEFGELFIPKWNQVLYAPQLKRASFCLLLSETTFSGVEKKRIKGKNRAKCFQKLIVKNYRRDFELSTDLKIDKGIMIPWFFDLVTL